jgi:DNA polymerase I-like protein with 3'-5' exonuclease and polymerase domains
MSSDYSQQEVKVMAQMCQDKNMIQAFIDGKDFYSSIASIAFNKPYEECLEFRPDGTTNPEGKERRSQAKSVLLGILYGRGINSIAEQLNCTKQKAQKIKDDVFKGFPAIEQFEKDSIYMAKTYGHVTTNWGRKRRLPDMQLPEFEFKYKEGYGDFDPLSFDTDTISDEVPMEIQRKYINKLHKAWGSQKRKIYEEAAAEGVIITDNGGKIADATRQCVNARIQGSAADLTKLAAIEIHKNKRLRELGFKLLVPVHDEFLGECPIENAKECAELFSKCMSDAAKDMDMPISTDVEITREWYGEPVEI